MQARKAKSDLAQNTLMQCKKAFVLITSHFSKDMFTVAALDSFDHQDRLSPTDMNKNHDPCQIFSS